MFIVLVWPIEVRIVAVRFWLSLSVRFHMEPLHPCLFIVYIIASSHALSYAFVTSRKVIYVGFLFNLLSLMSSLVLSM